MSRPKSSVILVGLLLILLPALAIVQYRWIGEVSAAERDRLESSVRSASDGFASDFADRKSTRLNSSHLVISYAVFCLKKKKVILSGIIVCPFFHKQSPISR